MLTSSLFQLLLAAVATAAPQIYVDCENGNVSGDGSSPARAIKSLHAAQEVVRQKLSSGLSGDLVVGVAAGTCYLDTPLNFTSADSGRDGFRVVWQGDDSNGGVNLSGGTVIKEWAQYNESLGVWKASAPQGLESRHFYADQKHMQRARQQIDRSSLVYANESGSYQVGNSSKFLLTLEGIEHGEIRGVNSFTDRYTPIDSLGPNDTLIMAQPAGQNNDIGWDANSSPFHDGGFFIENVVALLDEENEYYLNSTTGTIYFKPPQGQNPNEMYTIIPKLEQLLVMSGTYENPVHHITVSAFNYMHTTWNYPSTDVGYADQQTGAYIGLNKSYPKGEFESSRPYWWQIPGTVQASAVHNVTFTNGSMIAVMGGIGLGNNGEAHTSGVGLGVKDSEISGMLFTETGANSITVGGVQEDAHHPSDPSMIISDVLITENVMRATARTYTAGSSVMITYATGTVITRNDVSDAPYSGICYGWGWGTNDVGGNPEYVNRGLYQYQPIYDTPTTLKDGFIAENAVHDYGKMHTDLGGIYTLSLSSDTNFERNYIWDRRGDGTGVYHDEGSRDYVSNNMVIDMPGAWNWRNQRPVYTTGNLTLFDIAVTTSPAEGTNQYGDNVYNITQYASIADMPCDKQQVIYLAGIPPSQREERGAGTDRLAPSC